jgi:formiminoglutamase
VAPYLAQGSIVAILGGGHETSFGHFLGYVEADSPVDVVNWDAHPDVRAMRAGLGHSGSPFRQMLDHPSRGCRSYSVLGILDHSCSEAHLDLIRNRGGRVVRNADLGIDSGKEILMGLQGPVMVSFDLDAVDQAYSPGVSAPATGGLSSRDWLQYVRDSGACAAVSSVDFVEVSPALDRDRQTSRLAAAGLWNFLVGLSRR